MYLSLDIGGSTLMAAGARTLEGIAFAGEPIHERATGEFAEDTSRVIAMVQQVAAGEPIAAVGIGTTGTPNGNKTQIAAASNLRGWEGQPLVECLSGALNCPVFYDNDAAARALGQAYWGHTRGENFHYVINGTGVGGEAVSYRNGMPEVRGLDWREHFAAWQDVTGGRQLAARYRKRPEDFTVQEWQPVADAFKVQVEQCANFSSVRSCSGRQYSYTVCPDLGGCRRKSGTRHCCYGVRYRQSSDRIVCRQ